MDFKIEEGDFLAIIGTSGAGKSTLLNLIGLLDLPTSGQIFVQGEEVTKLSEKDYHRIRNSMIGFIFQDFKLVRDMTALENVEIPLAYSNRYSKKERHSQARDMLKRVGLDGKAQSYPDELSGGQKQRVAIARALANRPRLLIADEPTGNLDSETTQEVLALLQALHQEGITVIIVTHDPYVASHANTVWRMDNGQLHQE
ncbi:ABC transporter ATP-binding protein [Tumebacillus algifaecis]|uniref:ABC transporter ATP-binding protein n=1 Tax=Tumebacillus algifaecis TaxID=1214604 RepID=A0A223D763_9BACL|nr:ABC transporter ATP-binding protein [Tumebacillus algifaecis]